MDGKLMEKALKMGEVSATGSFHLFVGMASSTMIMAVGTIILARLMLPEEYGLYSIALIPSLMIGLFRDWGMDSAITKYVAYFRNANNDEDIRDIIAAGLTFEILSGLTLSLISLFLANFIASEIFQRPESTQLISIASIAIFSGALAKASQASFVGFERMGLNSLTIICQSIVKTAVSPLLVFLGYGALGALLGYTFSFLVASTIGLATLYLILLRNLTRSKRRQYRVYETLKKMLRYGVPLSVSSILGGFLVQLYGFMIVLYSSDAMIGNYQAATQFAVILTFFTFPISTVLFPAFAKLDLKNEHQLLQAVFTSSVKYTALLLVPATMAVIVLSKPLISALLGEKWVYAPFFLTLFVLNNLFVLFGGLIMASFLTGAGETKTQMKLGLLTSSFGIPLAFLLIPRFGIVGALLGTLLSGIPSIFGGLYWIWKNYRLKVDFKSSIKIFIASAIAAMITYSSLNFLNTAEWIRLITGGTIFLVVYTSAAPLIGAISKRDINNLRAMLSGLGIISRLMNIPLILMERASRT